MQSTLHPSAPSSRRILLLSMRGFRRQVANCSLYEFEDRICAVEQVDIVTLGSAYERSSRIYRWLKQVTGSHGLAAYCTPYTETHSLNHEYDLLVVCADNPWQLHLVNAIKGWRQCCKQAICYIDELWEPQLTDHRLFDLPFQQFDHLFIGSGMAQDLAQRIQRPCHFLLRGADALRFSPAPYWPARSVDFTYFGRRSEITHQALLAIAQRGNFYYHYDSLQSAQGPLLATHPSEHRLLFANLCKRSRYLMVNYAKIDRPQEIGNQQEISSRFFEGLAAGAVLIGQPAQTDVFAQAFDWPDSVIKIPFHEPKIGEILRDFNAQPERLEHISRTNVRQALLRHDWAYRWQQMLAIAGLEPTPQLSAHIQNLQALAQQLAL